MMNHKEIIANAKEIQEKLLNANVTDGMNIVCDFYNASTKIQYGKLSSAIMFYNENDVYMGIFIQGLTKDLNEVYEENANRVVEETSVDS